MSAPIRRVLRWPRVVHVGRPFFRDLNRRLLCRRISISGDACRAQDHWCRAIARLCAGMAANPALVRTYQGELVPAPYPLVCDSGGT